MTNRTFVMIDLSNTRFGRLVVKSFVRSARSGRAYTYIWLCSCDCGEVLEVHASNLRTGNTQSCGCLQTDLATARTIHGHSRKGRPSPTYRSWAHMKTRCLDPASDGYPYYGGRGITLCDRWLEFANFLADMGEAPPGTEIDRIDNSGNYTPENCRWSTRLVQARNTRKTRTVILGGKLMAFSEAAQALNIHISTITSWLRYHKTTHQEAIDYYAIRKTRT